MQPSRVVSLSLALALLGLASAQPATPEPCGTLDLTSPSTQHCFPADGKWSGLSVLSHSLRSHAPQSWTPVPFCHLHPVAHPTARRQARSASSVGALIPSRYAAGSHHFVCCVDIQTSDNAQSPHGNWNPLDDVIRAASDKASYSWCTCSEEVRWSSDWNSTHPVSCQAAGPPGFRVHFRRTDLPWPTTFLHLKNVAAACWRACHATACTRLHEA